MVIYFWEGGHLSFVSGLCQLPGIKVGVPTFHVVLSGVSCSDVTSSGIVPYSPKGWRSDVSL